MNFSEWNTMLFPEICDYTTGKLNSNQAESEGQYPFFTCSPEILRINSYAFDQDAVLLAGNNANGIFHLKRYKGKFNAYQRTYVINSKDYDIVSNKFVYYQLILKLNMLKEVSLGTATRFLTKTILDKIEFDIPNKNEMTFIADTLSCLDDKIELNNRINKTLEEMAQAIFKSWFVDFEPFQDGEFEQSELGMIPKGWRVGTLVELITDTIGGDWGKETSQGNFTKEVTCIRGADIPEIACGKKGNPATRFILKKNLEKKQLSEGQIIIEISGGSPTQSTGRTALVTKELVEMSDKPLICTNFCRALSLKKHSCSTFVYSMLQYLYKTDLFFLYENGTTGIKNLDTNNLFNRYKVVLPIDEIMVQYEEIFSTLLKTIYENGSQSDKLSAIRDNLLPKLMSGEIRVPIEEVV